MKKRVLIALVVILALTGSASMALADGTTTPPVETGPGSFTDPTPGVADDYTAGKFWLQSGSTWRGDLVLGSRVLWSIQMTGIDVSGLTGPGASGTFVRLGLQESVNWNGVFVQAHLDFYGAGGHLLQSFEGWNVKSSHGFNAGDVPGEFDLRFDIYQAVAGGTWHVTPYFRLEGDADWTPFWDGPWMTIAGWDITEGLVYVDIGSTTGTVMYDNISVQPIILVVDDDGVECPQRDYSTISEAMAAASDGVTIEVCAGTYDSSVETFPVTINKSLTLLGAQANVDPRPSQGGRTGSESIVDAGETSSAVMRISASDVEINGFTITGGTGDMVEESGSADNLLFRYNILYDDLATCTPGDEAIQIKYSNGVVMEYNYAYNICEDAFNLSSSSNGVVSYNEAHDIHSENAAIYCYDATNIDIIGNLVYNVPNNDGIKLGDSGDGSTGGIVEGNEVHDVAEDGITIYASGVTVENNTIYNCGSENGALYLYGADNTTVIKNKIYNNAAIGLLVKKSSNVTVEENEIYNNDDSDDTKYSGSAGIWLTSDASNVVINNNCIAGNADFGVKNEATTVINAEYNWWGDASGPSGEGDGNGDAVSVHVDYNPWLAELVYTGTPQPTTSVVLEATLRDSTAAGVPGADVDFYLDGVFVGSATTDASGVASLNIGPRPVGVYDAYATTAGCLETDPVLVPIYDPEGGFVTGGGWIWSPAGAYSDDSELEGKATFGFVSKYKKGAQTPEGNTEFVFKAADLNFHSDSYDWLVVAGAKAMFKGIGTINGEGEYKFMLTAIDANIKENDSFDVDRFRIKIWSEDEYGNETVVYDNGLGADDDDGATTEIGGGSIVIHTKKK
jgi:parallel beta-helix repeat protein